MSIKFGLSSSWTESYDERINLMCKNALYSGEFTESLTTAGHWPTPSDVRLGAEAKYSCYGRFAIERWAKTHS